MGGFKSWKVRAEALRTSQILWPVPGMSFLCAKAFGAPFHGHRPFPLSPIPNPWQLLIFFLLYNLVMQEGYVNGTI